MPESIVVQIITTAGLIVVATLQLRSGRKLNAIGADAKEAREQTANTHTTNLRDDIDLLKADTAAIRDDTGQMHADIRGIRKDINGLRSDDGEIRRSLRQAIEDRDLKITEVKASIPALIVQHIQDCPARKTD